MLREGDDHRRRARRVGKTSLVQTLATLAGKPRQVALTATDTSELRRSTEGTARDGAGEGRDVRAPRGDGGGALHSIERSVRYRRDRVVHVERVPRRVRGSRGECRRGGG